jgi:hypothetical protein
MKSDYILSILTTSPSLTITQITTSLCFLGIDSKFSSLHSLRMSVYQALRSLLKEGYVIRRNSDLRRTQHKYEITQAGLNYLQYCTDNLEVLKKLIERVA